MSEYTEVGKTVGRAGRGQGCIVGEMWKQQHMDQWVAGGELPLCLHMHQKRDREHEKAGRIKNEERDNFAGGGKDI